MAIRRGVEGEVGRSAANRIDFSTFSVSGWGTGRTLPANVEDRVLTLAGLRGRYENLFTQVIPLDGVTADAIITAGVTYAAKELF